MQAEPHVFQLDEVLQFISEIPGFRCNEFLNFTNVLENDHPAYRQWKVHKCLKQDFFEELCDYMKQNYKINCMGPEVHDFLWFIHKTYELDQNGVESFKKSLGQVRPYQEWLAAKSGKKVVTKRRTGEQSISIGHLRLVK